MSRIGSSKIRWAFVVLVLGLLAACQAPGSIKSSGMEKATVHDEARLRARLAEFHSALGANDIARWYAMTAPAVREWTRLENDRTRAYFASLAFRPGLAQKRLVRLEELPRDCGCPIR